MKDTYCLVRDGEMQMINLHISPYDKGSYFNEEPRRMRKLLLHKVEIEKLRSKVDIKGFTLVPTKMYFKQGLVKVEIGLAKGKELHDKRHVLQEKQQKRSLDREISSLNKY